MKSVRSVEAICLLGSQLFSPKLLPLAPGDCAAVFMREDRELCTHFRYHKHKLIFFLSAMRKYAEELRQVGYCVHYERLGDFDSPFENRLSEFLINYEVNTLHLFEVEDKFFETRLLTKLASTKVELRVSQSPMFLTSRVTLAGELTGKKKPFMKTFYQSQRQRLRILLEPDGTPSGGQWSFDEENRKPLPKGHCCPKLPDYRPDPIDLEVAKLVDQHFPEHPGKSEDFWLPTDRAGARRWAKDFFDQRLAQFGPYEDALPRSEPFVYHSVLTPYLNTGLITPKECVAAALRSFRSKGIAINSCEGFIRQVIGWREFVRGIYQNYSERQEALNFFNHHNRLTEVWYTGESGIAPLDDVIKKTLRYGYAHHIERLMVVGSLMLLLEVHPHEAHRWFMEMYIDSADWVMGPNVYGMALFSDGGIFATKPYICGSNYYRKMSGHVHAQWCDGVDGLYWNFIKKHREFFLKNPRMAMMVRSLDKMAPARLLSLTQAATELRSRLVMT